MFARSILFAPRTFPLTPASHESWAEDLQVAYRTANSINRWRASARKSRSSERSQRRPNDRATFGSSPLPLRCAYCIIGYRRHSRLTRGVITQPSTCGPWKPKQSQQPATHVTSRSVGNVMELRLPFFHSHWKRDLARLPASSSEHRSSRTSWGPRSC